MSYQMQFILIGVISLIVVITFFINMHLRNKRRAMLRYHQEPRLGELDEFESHESSMNKVSANRPYQREQTQSSPVTTKSTWKNRPMKVPDRSMTGLGLEELDTVMYGNLKSQNQASASGKLNFEEKLFKKNSSGSVPKKLIVMHIASKQGHAFVGYELLQALLAAGLRYGEMSIFHRYQQSTGQGKQLFSLASATEPGIFDMNKMGAFSCRGLSLFMQLNGAEHNEHALEIMVNTAYQLAEDLDGIVLDENRKPLSTEMLTEYQLRVQMHIKSS